jgi:NADH:ubiquinone oxidoreductase 24 kD subunit
LEVFYLVELQACRCGEMTEEEQYKLLGQIIEEYESKETNLIQVLHMAQAVFGYLPLEVQKFIADKMNIHLSKVSGVVSFYSFFSTSPKGRHSISVCLGTACYVRGGKKVLDKLKETLDIEVGETTPDRRFSMNVMRCIGACGLAPAMLIDGEVFKRVNPNKLQGILAKFE